MRAAADAVVYDLLQLLTAGVGPSRQAAFFGPADANGGNRAIFPRAPNLSRMTHCGLERGRNIALRPVPGILQ
jgi:hypothetical protein